MKKLVIGILAHVDAGKTTLSEGLLYLCGGIRKIGRVDHGDAFLDTYELEKERGITIFSKQALLKTDDMEVSLLDTPGHVDFSAEMERTLQVLDYAILVINGMDGVQSHTMTLWRLLERYQIPTFLFVNKMDQQGTDHDALLADLKNHLHENCVDFGKTEGAEEGFSSEQMENIAVCDEKLLEKYLETGEVTVAESAALIAQRKVFPCFFGSALKMEGVEEFLNGLRTYTKEPKHRETFGAKVFKIARDEQGNRLTYMKITGGSLKVKTLLSSEGAGQSLPGRKVEESSWEEKVDQIRLYSGAKYETTQEAEAGLVCAVTGLTKTYPGEGLGAESESELPVLEPVLNYQIILPDDCDPHQMLQKLRMLEEEEPQLHILWDSQLGEIHAQLMGEVQIEILKKMIWDRFHVAVEFGTGSIVYKETIAEPVEGVGHFEPLRHYAEVHLLIEPGEPGSGCQFFTACSEDVLARNWQRLILTHLEEKEHIGVLTGSPITDVQITLLTGRAHAKHTEGGDFRQATYRALRQGLMQAESKLLEPWYSFSLQVPKECVGRAMNDLQAMGASFVPPEQRQEDAVISGTAPVIKLQGYPAVLTGYTKGRGRLSCEGAKYLPCHNSDEVIAAIGYDPESDTDNPADSVFCSHGAGHTVKWNAVFDNMHIPAVLRPKHEPEHEHAVPILSKSDEEELIRIYERTYGPIRSNPIAAFRPSVSVQSQGFRLPEAAETGPEYLLVDGYNIIFAWDDLAAIAKEDMDLARSKLVNLMCNYRGLHRCEVILVFDAYRIKGNTGSFEKVNNISVVYTKEAETADSYIERTTHELSKNYRVQVATSDRMEQLIIIGNGAMRISADAFRKEVDRTEAVMRELMAEKANGGQKLMEGKISRDNKTW